MLINSSVGKKTINFSKQNKVLYGYEIVSELEDVLKGVIIYLLEVMIMNIGLCMKI